MEAGRRHVARGWCVCATERLSPFDAIDNQWQSICCSPCWFRRINQDAFTYVATGRETSGDQAIYRHRAAWKVTRKLYQIITDTEGGWDETYNQWHPFCRCEEKQYMVLMIVSGRSGQVNPVALRALEEIWVLLRG